MHFGRYYLTNVSKEQPYVIPRCLGPGARAVGPDFVR